MTHETYSSDYKFQKSFDKKAGIAIVDIVSPQGDYIYVVCRFMPTIDQQGNVVRGKIVGNIANIEEDKITLTEVLIPLLDYSPWDIKASGYDSLIGRRVYVRYENGKPVGAELKRKSLNMEPARKIKREDVWAARNLNKDKSFEDTDSPGYKLLKRGGYSDEDIKNTFSDKVDDYKSGTVINYGAADWQKTSQDEDKNNNMATDSSSSVANNVPKDTPKRKPCHSFTRAFRA